MTLSQARGEATTTALLQLSDKNMTRCSRVDHELIENRGQGDYCTVLEGRISMLQSADCSRVDSNGLGDCLKFRWNSVLFEHSARGTISLS